MTSKKDNLVILGIETSCDDTSVSILINGKIASLCSESSLAKHKTTGGIVPEVAARGHENSITRVYEKALKNAGIAQEAITHIAYTDHPGLPGSLHIGKIFAKSLAYLLNIPALPIDHMMGHAFSYAINKEGVVKFPLLSFVVSGGNTILYYFSNLAEYKIVNETQDDPVGECLDKIGRTLGLSYPGGVSIDKNYNEKYANIKMIDHQSPQTNFSFSGIKSHILNLVNQSKMKKTSVSKIALGSSALKWIMDDVTMKIMYYSQKYNCQNIAVGGGVSANSLLKEKLGTFTQITEKKYTGDNAAMIAFYAYLLMR